jgi:hypothetical protein
LSTAFYSLHGFDTEAAEMIHTSAHLVRRNETRQTLDLCQVQSPVQFPCVYRSCCLIPRLIMPMSRPRSSCLCVSAPVSSDPSPPFAYTQRLVSSSRASCHSSFIHIHIFVSSDSFHLPLWCRASFFMRLCTIRIPPFRLPFRTWPYVNTSHTAICISPCAYILSQSQTQRLACAEDAEVLVGWSLTGTVHYVHVYATVATFW